MKQSENTDNKSTSVIGSITGLLKQIYDETVSGNDVLMSISTVQTENADLMSMSVTSILNNQVINNGLIYRQTSFLSQISFGVLSLVDMIGNALDFDFKKTSKDSSSSTISNVSISSALEPVVTILSDIKNMMFGFFRQAGYTHKETQPNGEGNEIAEQLTNVATNLINNSLLSDNINRLLETIHVTILGTNNTLEQLLETTKSIFLYLPMLTKQGQEEPLATGAKSKTNEIIKLVQSLGTFKRLMTKKFLTDFEKFVSVYEKFVDEKNTKKLIAVSFNLSKFSVVLTLVAKMLETVKGIFNGLTVSIVLLTVTLLLPPFQLGFAYLVGMLKMLKATLGGGKDSLLTVIAMRKLALSIVFMVGAMYLLGKIPFGNVFKLLIFLTGLAGVMKLFQKKSPTQSITSSVSKKYGVTGIFSAAIGIAILVWSIDLASDLNFGKAIGLITFIGGLALVLFVFNKKKIGKSGPLDSLMNISIGLSILLLVIDACGEIKWTGALAIFGFIIGLGIAIALANKLMGGTGGGKFNVKMGMNVGMKGMFGFALGVAILILTIDACNELDWIGALKLLGFIGALGLVIALPQFLSKGKMNGKPMGGMLGFSIGVAILLLTIDAASEVDFAAAWKMIGVMGGIAAMMILMKRFVGPPKLVSIQIALFSGAIVAMSGALWVLSKVNINLTQIGTTFLAIFGFLGVLYVISKMTKQITVATGLMPLLTFSMAAMAGTVWLLSKSNVSFEQVGMFVISSLVIVGLAWLVGKIGFNLLIGSGILVGVSVAGLLAAIAVKKIGETNVSFGQVGMFVASVAIVTAMCFGLSFIGVPILIGAGILLALGVSILITAYGLKTVSEMNISTAGISAYITGLGIIAMGYFELTPKLLLGIVGAALAMIVGIATIVTAGALLLISEMKINLTNISLFGYGLVSLMGAYDKVGIVSAGKAVVKSALILPVVLISILTATAMRLISGMNIRPGSMEVFGQAMEDFLFYTTQAINKSLDSIKAVEPGLTALAKLVSVAGNLITVVQSYADMKIGVWKYNAQTGKMDLVSYKPITKDMLASVGTGIGTILQSLIAPLSIISSDNDTWNFGNGVIVKNPFKGGWFGTDNTSGAKRIEMIGNAFGSLITVIKNISDNKMLVDKSVDYASFNTRFMGIISMIAWSVQKIQTLNTDDLDVRSGKIGKFFEVLDKLQASQTKENNNITTIINELADKNKWSVINKNLAATNANIEKIVSNINKINIVKATALERNLRLFSEAKTTDGIKECIEYLKELIGLVIEQQEKQTQSQSEISNTFKGMFENNDLKTGINSQTGKPLTPVEKEKAKDDLLQQIVTKLETALSGIDSKLGGKLKVQIVDSGNGNWVGK